MGRRLSHLDYVRGRNPTPKGWQPDSSLNSLHTGTYNNYNIVIIRGLTGWPLFILSYLENIMLVKLENEAGRQREAVVFNIEDAVSFCLQYPDYGIFISPSYDGEVVDEVGFIDLLYKTTEGML